MSRDRRAVEVGEALGISYAWALRLKRTVGAEYEGTELIHACRELKEKERRSGRKRGVLPKGAGRVYCTASDKCDATAAADGEGSPIVLKHDDGCPEKYPIKDHLYDAGFPRDDSNGCIVIVADEAFWSDDALCGRPLSEHAHSEYPEDGR